VIGLGIDAVDVDRFENVLARSPRMAERLFTDGERALTPVARLAARFAVKEAVMKAMGVGFGAFGWHEVETVRSDSGAPQLVLTGAAATLADGQGITRWMVSLSHTDRTAVAVVAAL
jgi:holo-[acyl-carrier protein] synthase